MTQKTHKVRHNVGLRRFTKSATILLLLSVVLSTETCLGLQIPEMVSKKLGFLQEHTHTEKGSSRNYTDIEKDTFEKFKGYWESVTEENESSNHTISGKTNWEMPAWANGIFVSSGPSEHEVNGQEYNHFFDGLGRFSSFRFENGQVYFTSKMLKSKMYQTCKAENRAASGLLFAETTPARWSSYVPGANAIGQSQHGDNNWVSMERLADKKTFVGTTDDMIKLEIDIHTLEAQQWVKWSDKQMIVTGVAHSQTHSDGSVYSIGQSMGSTMKIHQLLYKMTPDDHLNRQVIASIPIDKFYYLHSFALTENYAVIFIAPIYFKNMLANSFAGKQIGDMWTQDFDDTTKMHVVSLKDGSMKTFDSKTFFFAVHFSQCYEDVDGKIIVEVPTMGNADVLIQMFMRENYNDIDKMSNVKRGSKLNRFTFDFEKGTFETKDLVTVSIGNIDFPQWNRDLKGKPAQYTYLAWPFGHNSFNESYSWPIVKYDDKLGDLAAKWAPAMTLAQEVKFIADPTGKSEDDGILVCVAYNFDRAETSLYVIDPKTMETLQEYPLPYKLSQGFHAEYFPAEQLE